MLLFVVSHHSLNSLGVTPTPSSADWLVDIQFSGAVPADLLDVMSVSLSSAGNLYVIHGKCELFHLTHRLENGQFQNQSPTYLSSMLGRSRSASHFGAALISDCLMYVKLKENLDENPKHCFWLFVIESEIGNSTEGGPTICEAVKMKNAPILISPLLALLLFRKFYRCSRILGRSAGLRFWICYAPAWDVGILNELR